MVATTIKGIYQDGKFALEKEVQFDEPVEVVIIFLEPETEKKLEPNAFSFYESLELTKDAKGNLSDLIVEERRAEKW